MLASAILLFDRPSVARAHLPGWFILCTTLIALTALLGQLFGAGPIYQTPGGSVIAVALPTVLSLLMISVGLFLERPDAVILRLAAAPGPGRVVLPRLAPVAVLAPVAFGLIAVRLLREPNIHEIALIFAALTVMGIAVSLLLVTTTAARLNRAHEALEQSAARQRLLAEVGAVFAGTLDFEETLTNIARLVVRDLADYSTIDVVEDGGAFRRARFVCRDSSKAWVCEALMRMPFDREQPRVAGSVFETRQPVLIPEVTPDVIRSWAQERGAPQGAANRRPPIGHRRAAAGARQGPRCTLAAVFDRSRVWAGGLAHG